MTRLLPTVPLGGFHKPHFSKWQRLQVLLDPRELEKLIEYLSPLLILNTSEVIPQEKISLPVEELVRLYEKYIAMLQGKSPRERISLSYALSTRIENFCAIKLSSNKYICRLVQPDVQLQVYSFLLNDSGKPLSQVFSSETVSFGLQFSYPAIFQDGLTSQVFSTTKNTFSGWKLWSSIRSWIRNHTFPLPICFQGKNMRLPIRLGQVAATWITSHIDLDRIPLDQSVIESICQKQTI